MKDQNKIGNARDAIPRFAASVTRLVSARNYHPVDLKPNFVHDSAMPFYANPSFVDEGHAVGNLTSVSRKKKLPKYRGCSVGAPRFYHNNPPVRTNRKGLIVELAFRSYDNVVLPAKTGHLN